MKNCYFAATVEQLENGETKKQAAELVTYWRQCHKVNGTALFNGRF